MVLVLLTEKLFEPLHHATSRDLTLKVLFLLAATSARRVSEIHALCIDPPFLFRTHSLFALRSCLITSIEVALTSDLEITAFYSEPTNALGVVLATRQVLGTSAEQKWHTYAVPFFPLGSVSPERGFSFLAVWMAHIP